MPGRGGDGAELPWLPGVQRSPTGVRPAPVTYVHSPVEWQACLSAGPSARVGELGLWVGDGK